MSEEKIQNQWLSSHVNSRAIRSLIFFILFYLYLWLKVDLRLIYHGGGIILNFPVFYRDWQFLREHLSYPGGPVEYVSAFLAQLWYIGWAGAIIATLSAWLIFICTDSIIRALNVSYLRFVSFVGPVLLLAIYTKYAYYFDIAVSLSAALLFVVLYLKTAQKNMRLSPVFFLVLSAILYYLAGSSYFLFAIICGIYERLSNGRYKIAVLYLLLAFAVPYAVQGHILGLGTHDLVRRLFVPVYLEHRMQIAAYILYLFVPLTMIIWGLGNSPIERLIAKFNKHSGPQADDSDTEKETPPAGLWFTSVGLFGWTVKTLILFVIAGAAVVTLHNNKLKALLEADYYACRRMWPEVIQTARCFPCSFSMRHMVNRAFYHTGRLGYDMFTFPQDKHTLFLEFKEPIKPELNNITMPVHWKKFGTHLELGLMNNAQHNLWESVEEAGERPVLLKNLALINMVKGNYNSARVYLGILNKTLFYADWADKYLDKLKSDPTLETDQQVQRLRSVMLTRDCGVDNVMIDKVLLSLLSTNKQNRMAFEYLMAYYLLTPKLDALIQNLYRLNDFHYTEIPPLYEEAILVYMDKTKETVDLHGFRISRQSVQRFDDCRRIFEHHFRNKQAAQNELAKHHGDSYFFYALYGPSGVTR